MTKPPAVTDLMPELTSKEDDFVESFVETGNAVFAATAAGYEQPGVQGRAIARRPRVMAAIRIATAKRIQSLAPLALNALVKVIEDANAPAGSKVDAAKAILDRGGYSVVTHKFARNDGTDVPLAEMSIPELERLVQDLEAKRAAEARDVTPEDVSAPLIRANDDQPVDPLG